MRDTNEQWNRIAVSSAYYMPKVRDWWNPFSRHATVPTQAPIDLGPQDYRGSTDIGPERVV